MSKQKQDGFTLIEIIITIAVFLIILPSIAYMVIAVNDINERARNLALVHSLVQKKVEELRSTSYTEIHKDGSSYTESFTDELRNTVGSNHCPEDNSTLCKAGYTVADVESGDPSLKDLEFNVIYSDHGEPRTFHYETYIGELGVGKY